MTDRPHLHPRFTSLLLTNWTPAALALAVLVLVTPAIAGQSNGKRTEDPQQCQNLEAPNGSRLAFHAYAEGVQIYRWNGTAWVFVAPDAVLYANGGTDAVVGSHYEGPTWESNSGSKVVARALDRCTPDVNSIPWLLLEVVSADGPGIFSRVAIIQRVNTVGGNPPASPGAFTGEESSVPYTAEYLFYRQHAK
jgi:hypothetical protein